MITVLLLSTFVLFSIIFLIYLLSRDYSFYTLWWSKVSASYTFALIRTHHSKLETLTVTFTAAWSFTCAAFPVNRFFVCVLSQFLDKSIRVSFHYVCFRLGYQVLLSCFVVTVLTSALTMAKTSFRKAFAIELETSRSITLALVGQSHW